MSNTFFISDTHFGHANAALKFTRVDNVTPMRIDPRTGERFESLESMDEYMIERWNSVVSDKDRVYHIGDFCMPRRSLQVLKRLKGRICIILGNHDPWKKKDWEQFSNVDIILGVKMFPKLGWVVTHIPVHERQLQGIWTHNIHGHLHENLVTKGKQLVMEYSGPRDDLHRILPDKRYVNVCVEHTEYTPIELEELKKRTGKA